MLDHAIRRLPLGPMDHGSRDGSLLPDPVDLAYCAVKFLRIPDILDAVCRGLRHVFETRPGSGTAGVHP